MLNTSTLSTGVGLLVSIIQGPEIVFKNRKLNATLYNISNRSLDSRKRDHGTDLEPLNILNSHFFAMFLVK